MSLSKSSLLKRDLKCIEKENKNYIDSLEKQNNKLKQENKLLKIRIEELEAKVKNKEENKGFSSQKTAFSEVRSIDHLLIAKLFYLLTFKCSNSSNFVLY